MVFQTVKCHYWWKHTNQIQVENRTTAWALTKSTVRDGLKAYYLCTTPEYLVTYWPVTSATVARANITHPGKSIWCSEANCLRKVTPSSIKLSFQYINSGAGLVSFPWWTGSTYRTHTATLTRGGPHKASFTEEFLKMDGIRNRARTWIINPEYVINSVFKICQPSSQFPCLCPYFPLAPKKQIFHLP